MNINYIVKKKHLFKRRKSTVYYPQLPTNFRVGLYSTNSFRFELIYLKTFKKVFRRKYFKRKTALLISKFWLMIKPNFLLTMKSKNSRMGSGVGSYVRVCSIIKPNKPIILLKNFPRLTTFKIVKYLKRKLNINLIFNTLKL